MHEQVNRLRPGLVSPGRRLGRRFRSPRLWLFGFAALIARRLLVRLLALVTSEFPPTPPSVAGTPPYASSRRHRASLPDISADKSAAPWSARLRRGGCWFLPGWNRGVQVDGLREYSWWLHRARDFRGRLGTARLVRGVCACSSERELAAETRLRLQRSAGFSEASPGVGGGQRSRRRATALGFIQSLDGCLRRHKHVRAACGRQAGMFHATDLSFQSTSDRAPAFQYPRRACASRRSGARGHLAHASHSPGCDRQPPQRFA